MHVYMYIYINTDTDIGYQISDIGYGYRICMYTRYTCAAHTYMKGMKRARRTHRARACRASPELYPISVSGIRYPYPISDIRIRYPISGIRYPYPISASDIR